MRERVVAKRYAAALLEVALEKGVLDEALEGLDAVAGAMKKVPLFAKMLMNSEIATSQRSRIIEAVCDEMKVEGVVQNLMMVMLFRERLGIVTFVAKVFRDMVARAKKLTRAEATVADEALSQEVCTKIKKVLEDSLKQSAQCKPKVDPSLIGGVVLRLGDTVLDASVRGRLERLKERILDARY